MSIRGMGEIGNSGVGELGPVRSPRPDFMCKRAHRCATSHPKWPYIPGPPPGDTLVPFFCFWNDQKGTQLGDSVTGLSERDSNETQ